MDRNSIIGILLIVVIIVLYGVFNKPSKEEIAAQKREADSLRQVQIEQQIAHEQTIVEQQPETTVIKDQSTDSVNIDELKSVYGDFATAAHGEQEFVTIENDLVKLVVSTKGGRPFLVDLKEFKKYSQDPLLLFHGDSTIFGFNFFANNRSIATNDLFFVNESGKDLISVEDTPQSLVLKLHAGEQSYIEYIYTLTPGSYNVDFDINFVNMDHVIAGNLSSLNLLWEMYSPQQEKGSENEGMYTTVSYKYYQDEVNDLRSRGKDENLEEINGRISWIAFQQQFFSAILQSDEFFLNALVKFEPVPDNEEYLRKFTAEIAVPYKPGGRSTLPLSFYFGPNHYKTLKSYEKDFERMIELGGSIFGWINRGLVIPVFNWLDNYITSYGLIILILTILIKIILFPLTYKSYLSTAKMRVLKPEIEEISKKFPKREDSMKKQQATMALYKKAGVNPMGGCLPMLIQFPILIAMFRFFPTSFELRQKSFLWADDLSSYDSILDLPWPIPGYGDHVSLFTILMAAALFLTTRVNSAQMNDANSQMPGMKFMMNYMMPVMMLVFFNRYAAGLSYYYFLSNVITFGQTIFIRRFVDEEEILRKLHENKKKPAKKSKWQARLEDAAKQKGYKPPKKK